MEILFLTTFGKAFVPKKLRPNLRLFFEKTGRDEVPYHTFGIIFWIAAAISYIIYLTQAWPYVREQPLFSGMALSFIVFAGLMLSLVFILSGLCYFYLTLQIYKRTKEMEDRLPDYLTLVNTSLKGGYSFEKALWGAIKPEFGILAREIGLVSKRVMTGNDVNVAMREFALKYASPILRRSIDLIVGELESGGKIVDVIERVILDLKKTKSIKQEMSASTLSYIIFISALVMFVMPALFALSYLLFNVISGFLGDISNSLNSSPISIIQISGGGVDEADFRIFNILAVTIISTFSGIIVSVIEKGDWRGGIRYIPMFVLTSLFIYFLLLQILSKVFTSFTGFGA